MRSTIALNGSFFNTHRMLQEYISNAYYPEEQTSVSSTRSSRPWPSRSKVPS